MRQSMCRNKKVRGLLVLSCRLAGGGMSVSRNYTEYVTGQPGHWDDSGRGLSVLKLDRLTPCRREAFLRRLEPVRETMS